MKTLENPIFPISIKSSLLPRLDYFESSLLPRLDCFESSLLPRPDCFEGMLLRKNDVFPMYNYYYKNIVYLIV